MRAPSGRSLASFIRRNLPLAPVPGVPEIRLHLAGPGSRLSRLSRFRECGPEPPYWAYAWAGGLALARHVLDRPAVVAGRTILDFGAGSGLVAIAAAKAGARQVFAADSDAASGVARALNAEANGVVVESMTGEHALASPPPVDLVFAGDVFYAAEVAENATRVLAEYRTRGTAVLVGDPGRKFLPTPRLRWIADYPTGDVGDPAGSEPHVSAVYELTG